MSIVATLWGTREAISLLADLSALLDAAKDDPDQTLRQTILDFRKVAIGTSDKLSQSLTGLVRELNDLGINLDIPEQDATNQLRGMFNLSKKMTFKRLTQDLHSLEEDIRAFADDVESLLLCAQRNREISETATTSYAVRTELNELALKNASVSEQMKTMSEIVERIGKHLRSA